MNKTVKELMNSCLKAELAGMYLDAEKDYIKENELNMVLYDEIKELKETVDNIREQLEENKYGIDGSDSRLPRLNNLEEVLAWESLISNFKKMQSRKGM